MPLVDLRDHADDEEVRALLRAPDGVGLVGWRDGDGELVACTKLERAGDDTLAVRGFASRTPEAAEQLFAALAAMVPARRILSEVPLPAGCGFVDGVLELDATPHAAAAPPTLAEIEAAVRAAWTRDTSEDPDEWTQENPARGHCAVTALLLRELLGGDIVIANVIRDGRRVERHAWNRLRSGVELDLTRDQFRAGEQFGPAAVEEPLFTDAQRLTLLRERVLAALR